MPLDPSFEPMGNGQSDNDISNVVGYNLLHCGEELWEDGVGTSHNPGGSMLKNDCSTTPEENLQNLHSCSPGDIASGSYDSAMLMDAMDSFTREPSVELNTLPLVESF